jgi:hypothetical protein
MERWRVRSFDADLSICDELKGDSDVAEAVSIISGECPVSNSPASSAVRIHNSILQRSIIEALLIAEDCSDGEIESLTGVKEDVICCYKKIFFDKERAFLSKIDLIDYIETGVSFYSDIENEEMLNIFLLLRWTIALGKEFVIWKFRLAPTEYSADRLYNVVMKEAFFYHKEKSMGNTDITLSEYLRSDNTLLSSVKASTTIKQTSEDDAGFDILDQLGIIVEEKEAPGITLDELNGDDFINNALQQETT